MHFIKLTLLIAFCLLQSFGCTTLVSDKRPEGVVVERNKQSRPVWADSPTTRLFTSETETRYHYAMIKQRDLPIAVKLSQTNAIKESFRLWRSLFGNNLQQVSQVKRLQSSTKYAKDLTYILDSVASKMHGDLAQIEDIYYERIRIDHPEKVPELRGVSEYFDVHSLVKIAPIEIEKLKKSLAAALSATRNPEFKKVGKELSSGNRKTN